MGSNSRCSNYLQLQVWCGLLTVAMVVMAAVLTSVKLISTEKDGVSTWKPQNATPTASVLAPFKSGATFSFIQLTMSPDEGSWQSDTEISSCESCPLVLLNNSIHCTQDSLYFFYAQVTFNMQREDLDTSEKRTVTLFKNGRADKSARTLFESVFPSERLGSPSEMSGSVFVAKIVRLQKGDSVSLTITADYQRGPQNTYWGAYQLH
ncbi:lymphotoxin-alpha [Centroberyx affinis]|uniref:lymphotoxin-alpha n=1 Tax=Centroberyx affinis TaxID=166261 RepID=UPI003A5C2988